MLELINNSLYIFNVFKISLNNSQISNKSQSNDSRNTNKSNKSSKTYIDEQKEIYKRFKDGDLVQEVENIENIFEIIMDFKLIQDHNLQLAYFKDDEECKIKLIEKIEKSDKQEEIFEQRINYYTNGKIIYLGIEIALKYNDDYYIVLKFLNTGQIVQVYKDQNDIFKDLKQIKAPVQLARTVMDVFVYLFQKDNKKIILDYLNNHQFQLIYPEKDKNLYILSFIRARTNMKDEYIGKFSFDEDRAFQAVGNCILNFYTGEPPIIKHSDYDHTKRTFDKMKDSKYNQSHIYFWIIAAMLIHRYLQLKFTIEEVDNILKYYQQNQSRFETKGKINEIVNVLKERSYKEAWEIFSLNTITQIAEIFK